MTEKDFKQIEKEISDYRNSKNKPFSTHIDYWPISLIFMFGIMALCVGILADKYIDKQQMTNSGAVLILISILWILIAGIKVHINQKRNALEKARREAALLKTFPTYVNLSNAENVLRFVKIIHTLPYETTFGNLATPLIEALGDLGLSIRIHEKVFIKKDITLMLNNEKIEYHLE
jgi:hypothetical protein